MPIEAVNGHGQCGQKPDHQHTVGMMMTEVLQAMKGLGFIEPLIFNLPNRRRRKPTRKNHYPLKLPVLEQQALLEMLSISQMVKAFRQNPENLATGY